MDPFNDKSHKIVTGYPKRDERHLHEESLLLALAFVCVYASFISQSQTTGIPGTK